MRQSTARRFIFIALICSSLTLILSSISFSIPRWKTISIPENFSLIYPFDPLIRSEFDKYLHHLYQPGQSHLIGLDQHCLSTGLCGENSLPTFDLEDFGQCQNLHFHRQCLFAYRTIDSSERCRCEKPLYVRLIQKFIIFALICQSIFLLVNVVRLFRQRFQLDFLDDIKFRLIAIISSFFSSICVFVVLVQMNLHRLDEPLEFFEMMLRHYSHLQINSFTRDIQIIIEHLETTFEFHFGFCYTLMNFVLIFSLISFICSSIVEIKIDHLVPNRIDEEKTEDYYQNPSILRERFPQQTNV